tara:strand:+ start:78 stop:479 length:402 start_codon:yes stop_codon:yes gene_type:complete
MKKAKKYLEDQELSNGCLDPFVLRINIRKSIKALQHAEELLSKQIKCIEAMSNDKSSDVELFRLESFAARLGYICDEHPDIPPLGSGRQTTLARRVGVSQEAVRRWLAGLSEPRTKIKKKLAFALDTSIYELL